MLTSPLMWTSGQLEAQSKIAAVPDQMYTLERFPMLLVCVYCAMMDSMPLVDTLIYRFMGEAKEVQGATQLLSTQKCNQDLVSLGLISQKKTSLEFNTKTEVK
ncbi:uncharacterized protein LOC106674642 [Maylandia zebra]|uniref:uncharacterized protein LOC106674642 n=1 Tax=Maylandia zebra TaxID=106582 RepID=UPI00403CBA72